MQTDVLHSDKIHVELKTNVTYCIFELRAVSHSCLKKLKESKLSPYWFFRWMCWLDAKKMNKLLFTTKLTDYHLLLTSKQNWNKKDAQVQQFEFRVSLAGEYQTWYHNPDVKEFKDEYFKKKYDPAAAQLPLYQQVAAYPHNWPTQKPIGTHFCCSQKTFTLCLSDNNTRVQNLMSNCTNAQTKNSPFWK